MEIYFNRYWDNCCIIMNLCSLLFTGSLINMLWGPANSKKKKKKYHLKDEKIKFDYV